MGTDEDNARETLESMGIEFAPEPPKREYQATILENEWETWASTIEVKVNRQGQLVIGIAAGLVVTLGFTVLMGRVVLKLVEGQKAIVLHLNNTASPSSDSSEGERPSTAVYSRPSNRVDTAGAVVDEDLKADLESKIAASSQVEVPDDLK
ncbi:MAG TPA: hypothetical protein VGF75_06240 [Candidatus Saccharimonadales bacterium]|jgi:hypothetical protein